MNYLCKIKKWWMHMILFPAFFQLTYSEAEARMGAGVCGFGNVVGLLDIFLLGAILFGMSRLFKKRRQAAEVTAINSPMAYGGLRQYDTWNDIPQTAGGSDDVLDPIREMDYSFNEKRFKENVADHFVRIQGAWTGQDLSGVRSLLTDEIYGSIQQEVEGLRAKQKINKRDGIVINSIDIIKTWQADDRGFITVRFDAHLLDYILDEANGEIVSGSRTEPVKFTEDWTFTRPVGNKPWLLAAIHSGNHMEP